MTSLGTAIGVSILVITVAFCGNAMYTNWIVGLQYERELGQYFSYADSASDADTKSQYFGQYISAIEKLGYNKGVNSILYKEQPNADLTKKFKVAQSLQLRLQKLSTLDETDTAYQLGMTQINDNEFCWFPANAFEQKFHLEHGDWGVALTPEDPYNRCD